MVNQNPFQRSAQPVSTKVDQIEKPIALLDLDVLADRWNAMNVSEKSSLIASKFPRLSAEDRIALIARLDAAHPPARAIEYRERLVYVPAGQVAQDPATPGSMSVVGWGLLLLVAGGILYATVNQESR